MRFFFLFFFVFFSLLPILVFVLFCFGFLIQLDSPTSISVCPFSCFYCISVVFFSPSLFFSMIPFFPFFFCFPFFSLSFLVS